MLSEEFKRHGEIVECIRDAVGKSTVDEQRDTKKQKKYISFTGKSNCSGHDESATDSEQAASYRSCSQSSFKDLLGSLRQA